MKTYDVNLMMNFSKHFLVNAYNKEEALDLVKNIFFDTDLINLSDDELDSIDIEIESDGFDPCECCEEDCDCPYCKDEEHLCDEVY